MTNKELSPNEYDAYYKRYIYKLANEISLVEGFIYGKESVVQFFNSIPKHQHTHRYEQDKWSIKEVFQHLIDTERVFMYRCFRIARRDETPLSGFNQDIFIQPSMADDKTMKELIGEFEATRSASISLLKSLKEEDLKAIGNSSGKSMSARAAAFVIIGHEIWHKDVINERYL